MTDTATLNDTRAIAAHICEYAEQGALNAICHYAAILKSGTGEFPIAVIRNFILALTECAPRQYDRLTKDMTDQERTLFDNMIAAAVLRTVGKRP